MAIRPTTGSDIGLAVQSFTEEPRQASSQKIFRYSRDQFPFIDRGLWQILTPYHHGSDELVFPNFTLREGSEWSRLEILRTHVYECLLDGDKYLYQIHFASLEEIIRIVAADQGIAYHEPREFDIPTFDFVVEQNDFWNNPRKFLVVETQTGMRYQLTPTEAQRKNLFELFNQSDTPRAFFSVPRTNFGVGQSLDQVYEKPRWKQLEGSMTQAALPRPLYELRSTDGETVLTGVVMPELDLAMQRAEAKQDCMAAGKDMFFAIVAAAGGVNATSNSWLARQPFMPLKGVVDMEEVAPGIWVTTAPKRKSQLGLGQPVAAEEQPTTSPATTRTTTLAPRRTSGSAATRPIYPSTIVGRSLEPAKRILLSTDVGARAVAILGGPLSQGAAALTGVALGVDAVQGVVVDRVTQAMLTLGVERLLGTVTHRSTNPPEEGGVSAYVDQPSVSQVGTARGDAVPVEPAVIEAGHRGRRSGQGAGRAIESPSERMGKLYDQMLRGVDGAFNRLLAWVRSRNPGVEFAATTLNIDGRNFAGLSITPNASSEWGLLAQRLQTLGNTGLFYLPQFVSMGGMFAGPSAMHFPDLHVVAVSHDGMVAGKPGAIERHELRHVQLMHDEAGNPRNPFLGRVVGNMFMPTFNINELSAGPVGVAYALSQAPLLVQNPSHSDLMAWRFGLGALAPQGDATASVQSTAQSMVEPVLSTLQNLNYQPNTALAYGRWQQVGGFDHYDVFNQRGRLLFAIARMQDAVTGTNYVAVSLYNGASRPAIISLFPVDDSSRALAQALDRKQDNIAINLIRQFAQHILDPWLSDLSSKGRTQLRLYGELDQIFERLAEAHDSLKRGSPIPSTFVAAVNQEIRKMHWLGQRLLATALIPGEQPEPWMMGPFVEVSSSNPSSPAPLPTVPDKPTLGAAANPDPEEHRRLAAPADIAAHVAARCANDPRVKAVYNALNDVGFIRMREDGSVYVKPLSTWSEGRQIVDVIWREALAQLGFSEGQKLTTEENMQLRNAMQDIGGQIDWGDPVGIGRKGMNESLRGLWAWQRFLGKPVNRHNMSEEEARNEAFTHGPNNRGASVNGLLEMAVDGHGDVVTLATVTARGGYYDVGRLLIESYAAEKVGLQQAQDILAGNLGSFFEGSFDPAWDETTYAERFQQRIGQLMSPADRQMGLGSTWQTNNPIQIFVSLLSQSDPADALRILQTWRESIRLSYTQSNGILANEGLCFSAAVLAGFLSEFTTRLFQIDYKVEGWDQQRLQQELWSVVMEQVGELDVVLGQMGTDVRVPNEASLYTLREHLQGILNDARSSGFVTGEDRVVIDRVLKRWDRVLLWNDAYRIRSRVVEDKTQIVREANLLVPLQISVSGTAPRIISTQDVVFLARVLRETAGKSEYKALRTELEKRLRGTWVCDANCDQLTGSDTGLADLIGRYVPVYDHHGRFAQPHGTNATHLVLNRLEEVLKQKQGDVAAAKAALNVQDVATDNMFDGITCAWIVAHLDRVLANAELRTFLRQVATFEDFTAFTGRYHRNSPEAMFVAAMAAKGNQVLTRRGIMGSDRFSADQTSEIVTEMMAHFDRVLDNERTRAHFAGQFWSEIDRAVGVALSQALLADQSVAGQFSMFDDSRLVDPRTNRQFPVLTRWLAYPIANVNPVQVVATPLPTGRYLYILANRHGETLPCGRDISVALDALNRAEGTLSWTAREDVVAHFGAGSKLKPAEVSKILRDPANGFFERSR